MRKERVRRNRRIPEHVKKTCLQYLTQQQWSPRQISGYLAQQDIKISHETIYRWIRQDKAEQGRLYTRCRHKLKHRKRAVGKISNIPARVSIHDIPQEADGKRLGDFEMDLIVGAQGKGAILVVTERMTNMIWAGKLKSKTASEVNRKLWAILIPYRHILKTIVTDNGSEFSGHLKMTKMLGLPIFFADPYAAWQKGAVEHANKLIRQYIPKNTDFSNISKRTLTNTSISSMPDQDKNLISDLPHKSSLNT